MSDQSIHLSTLPRQSVAVWLIEPEHGGRCAGAAQRRPCPRRARYEVEIEDCPTVRLCARCLDRARLPRDARGRIDPAPAPRPD